MHVEQVALAPKPEFGQAARQGVAPHLEPVARVRLDGQREAVERDPAVGVDRALGPQAEDILDGLKRRLQLEWAPHGRLVLQGGLEPPVRDFPRRGMAPLIIVAADFLAQQDPGLADIVGVGSHAGADQAILQPLIGPLDLALGLGGPGVGECDPAVLEDSFPLRSDLVGELAMVAPDRIPALDEAED